MPLITKISRHPIGEFVIKFSTRHNRFEIDYPTTSGVVLDRLSSHVIKRNHDLLKWADVEKELQSIVDQYRTEFLMTRKVIIISLKTSESVYGVTKESVFSHKLKTEPVDRLRDVEGFELKWYVAEEYTFGGDEGKERDLRYKIIETNKNNSQRGYLLNQSRDHVNIMPQLLHEDNPRVFTYTDELYAFIKEVEGSITQMLNRMVDYFSIDPQVFLANVENKTKLLTSSS